VFVYIFLSSVFFCFIRQEVDGDDSMIYDLGRVRGVCFVWNERPLQHSKRDLGQTEEKSRESEHIVLHILVFHM
jgi:hypothetical protein